MSRLKRVLTRPWVRHAARGVRRPRRSGGATTIHVDGICGADDRPSRHGVDGNERPDGVGTGDDGDGRAALAAFRNCMADHGITLPERGASGGQGGPSFPQGGPPTSTAGGGGDPAARSARQEYRRCLADQGVAVATTVTDTPGPPPSNNDPAFPTADQMCRPLLPTTTTTPGAPQ